MMEQTFNSTMKTGEIVTQFPQAADIFKKYRIDFCCGGNIPLEQSLEKLDLNKEEVIQTINEAYSAFKERNENHTNWDEAAYTELIEHIQHTHHAFLSQELPELSKFVTKIFYVHGGNHPHLAEVHKLFHDLKTDLEQHTVKEDTNAFPLILDFDNNRTEATMNNMKQVIEELEAEHDHAGDILKEIRRVTNDYQLPPGACMTYSVTYKRLEELESDMFQHIHLENNILFPRALKENL